MVVAFDSFASANAADTLLVWAVAPDATLFEAATNEAPMELVGLTDMGKTFRTWNEGAMLLTYRPVLGLG